MADDEEVANERSRLLPERRRESVQSIVSSHISKEEQYLSHTSIGERLPYSSYTTIDWLHGLVKSSYHYRDVHGKHGLRYHALALFDASQGWIIAALCGICTATVAAIVDLAVPIVSDWKFGYCKSNLLASKDFCCRNKSPFNASLSIETSACGNWQVWSTRHEYQFAAYVSFALLFGIVSGAVTLTTKQTLPIAAPGLGNREPLRRSSVAKESDPAPLTGKTMYMAAGSGIPEIKTVLSGFVIPHLLDFRVLVVKAIGSIFAVSTGMCLGKEGPFVHISVCVANLIGTSFLKYANNERKLREVYAAGCAAGLSVAFGAPIGGVLFAFEEISTYFPRKVLWRAFICSLSAAITLRQLDPFGSGRLVLFETNYGALYAGQHYPVFIVLGIFGGLFGGLFCKLNYLWSQWFRKYAVIKQYPVLEVFLVVLFTAVLQFPNPMTREPGDVSIKNLLVDCSNASSATAYVCVYEHGGHPSTVYLAWLVYGLLIKLILTIITFGIKVPSGVIIPALCGGAFCGRLIGQLPFLSANVSPGIFAMVGAGAFLAGVSRMTISLAVIMFELTGELEFVVPNMIGIMVAKWVADALEKEGVYDLAQTVLGHPFLDLDASMVLVQKNPHLVEELIPPPETMREIKVELSTDRLVSRKLLERKLNLLKRRGLMDAGLVLVRKDTGMLLGYLAQAELEFGLTDLCGGVPPNCVVKLFDEAQHQLMHDSILEAAEPESMPPSPMSGDDVLDLSSFVDRTPLTLTASAPLEYAVEMFGKLGLRYLMITEEGTGRLTGVVIKKRLVDFLDRLKEER